MSSRERRRWVIDRLVAKRVERAARERAAGTAEPAERAARRKQSEEPRSK